jgi:hypothetical protein
MPENPSPFWRFIIEYRKQIGLTSGTLVSSLCLCYWFGPAPAREISAGLSLAEVVLLVGAFYWRHEIRTRGKAFAIGLLVVFIAGFINYCFLRSRYTVRPFDDRPFIVEGTQLRSQIQKEITSGHYNSEMDALNDNRYDSDYVWTPDSVARVHEWLVICWAALILSFSGFVFVLILLGSSS